MQALPEVPGRRLGRPPVVTLRDLEPGSRFFWRGARFTKLAWFVCGTHRGKPVLRYGARRYDGEEGWIIGSAAVTPLGASGDVR